MKVRMKSTSAGPGGTMLPGSTVEVDNQTGIDLVRGGFAEMIGGQPRQETAAIKYPESVETRKRKVK